MSNLIKENANLQKQLQGANKRYYEDLLVYVPVYQLLSTCG